MECSKTVCRKTVRGSQLREHVLSSVPPNQHAVDSVEEISLFCCLMADSLCVLAAQVDGNDGTADQRLALIGQSGMG